MRPRSGFSLIEMAVTLAVAGILAAIAFPSLGRVIVDNRVRSAANEIHGALFLARSEAIKRGRRVTMCTSADGLVCVPGIGWHRGWILFEDGNGNGTRDAEERIVQAASASFPDGISITGNTPVRNRVAYVPSGVSLQMGSITICSGEEARRVVINITGRPRVERGGEC